MSRDPQAPFSFIHVGPQGTNSDIMVSAKSRNKSEEPLYVTLLNSKKGKS